jgi:hypothetical protein
MVNFKRLVCLDQDCLEILKDIPNKKNSDYIRKAIKKYHISLKEEQKPEIKNKPIEETPKKIEVRLL